MASTTPWPVCCRALRALVRLAARQGSFAGTAAVRAARVATPRGSPFRGAGAPRPQRHGDGARGARRGVRTRGGGALMRGVAAGRMSDDGRRARARLTGSDVCTHSATHLRISPVGRCV